MAHFGDNAVNKFEGIAFKQRILRQHLIDAFSGGRDLLGHGVIDRDIR
jgi:hypothetical protein